MAMCKLNILFVLLALWINVCTCQYTYNIYPKCHTNKECLTLLDIVDEKDRYFTSNVTLVFHPGDHSLQDENLSVANISNLTLLGSTTGTSSNPITRIVGVNGRCSLSFSGVSNLHIVSINFVSCRCELLSTVSVFHGCSFENSTAVNGGAMAVYSRSDASFLGLTVFTGNTATQNGGAIFANNSFLNFSGTSTFTDNHSISGRGGALCAYYSNTLSFNGTIHFNSNTADKGGALYALHKNKFSFSGNCTVQDCKAEYAGGALYAIQHNTLYFSGNSDFEANKASYGGALCVQLKNTLRFSGNSNFDGNTAHWGGVVYAQGHNTLSFIGNSSLKGNTAGNGGAVCAEWINTLIFRGNSGIEENTAENRGGALWAYEYNTLNFIGNSTYKGNTAKSGGALWAYEGNTLSFSGISSFESNTADSGGALYAQQSNTASFNGNSNFEGNRADKGGAVYAQLGNTLSFNGNSSLEQSTAIYGGAVWAYKDNTLNFRGNNSFEWNTAKSFGGAFWAYESNNFRYTGNSKFEGNTAGFGGAFYVGENNNLCFNGNSNFAENTAGIGGALFANDNSTLNFSGNSSFEGNRASISGGSLSYSGGHVVFTGDTSFSYNTAVFGGAVYATNSITQLTESTTIRENSATNGGGVFVQGGIITFEGACSCIKNNASQDGYGGAIIAINSIVRFNGTCQLTRNTAGFGGGVALVGVKDRTLLLQPGTRLSFTANVAHKRGGALYVEDNPFTYCVFNTTATSVTRDGCFMQFFDPEGHVCDFVGLPLFGNTTGMYFNYSLNFENNTAVESGDALYGGNLDFCGVCLKHKDIFIPFQGWAVFRQITNANKSSQHELSSDPYKVCICENNQPNCNQTTIHVHVYPGHVLSIALVSVGQLDGVVPSRVIHAVMENLTITSDFKVIQPAEHNKSCSRVYYPLLSEKTSGRLKLYSEEPCFTSGFALTFHVTFLPCPIGFTLSDQGTCICDKRLQEYTQACAIQNLTINREQGDTFWVGVERLSRRQELVLHPHCPFAYCTEEAVSFTLNRTDLQCFSGRSGVLCGACQSGHSLALGSSRCLSDCSNKYLALLFAFAAAGIVLVAFLFLCRLTVAEGTLSGLIFYANFLAVNQSIFFPDGRRNALTVFIAWLNLDLGIEMCFFVGLDTYSRTWLQFVFPIYIWVLVGLVIYLANMSTTFARIIGRTNPVAILATLFLLSYTKLLRAIMAAFSFTTLDYPGDESRLVWLYDGNIGYLDKHDGRHIVLFLASLLVFFFVSLPYTLLLLCGQWIQRKFQRRWLSLKNQLYLKAFLDAHYAPFHNKHRYWTGLLLLLRFFIVLLSTIANISHFRDPLVSLVVLLCVVSGMLVWGWFVDRPYKKWCLNMLEASFMFNLIVLIGGTYQIRLSGGNQAALVYTSVSIAFTTFIGMVISPVLRQVKERCERRRPTTLLVPVSGAQISDDEETLRSPLAMPPSSVTHSVVEIARQHSQTPEDDETRPLLETATY